jgi:predicted enzyme related to lactoylglutathione lyase
MANASLGSILLASADAQRLRHWYSAVFEAAPTEDNFLVLGDVGMLVDERDDVAERTPEPARVILNFHVDDIHSAADRLRANGAELLVEPVWRGQAWFATAVDPDGNHIQIIELSPEYFTSRGLPVPAHRSTPAPASTDSALARSDVATRLPAQDLDRARAFYADKLGLEPLEERPGGLRYRCGSTIFALFASAGAPSGEHTQMGWSVDDIDAVVAELRGRGVVFEDYDLPGLRTVDGIAEITGNYPSEGGVGERGAWFRDSEGNLIGLGQRTESS